MISLYVSSSWIRRAVALGQLVLFVFLLACNDKPQVTSGVSISSISPEEGPIEGGTTLSISGTNIKFVQAIDIDGSACTNLTVVGENMTCRTPSHAEGDVTVTVSEPTLGSASGNFRYVLPPLEVSSFSPTAGPTTGGGQFTVRGRGFSPGITVTIGGSSCASVIFDSSTSIRCTLPALAAGSYNVVVTDADGDTVTPATRFVSSLTPTVTGITPVQGSSLGGTVITITGTNFVRPVVNIGSVPCDITASSSTSITCTTTARAAATVNVRVENFDGNGVVLNSAYTYIQHPTPLSVSPAFGVLTGGTTVTVTGDFFRSGATVLIDGVSCTPVTFISRTTLTCVTPAGSLGAKTVTVTNPNTFFGTLANGFTYRQPAPDVTSVSPTGGPLSGGTTFTLTGTGFQVGATATVEGRPCTSPNVTAPTTMTCVSPIAFTEGAKNIVITNPDGQTDTLPASFTYQAPPTITSISPAFGPLAGGTTLTITGTIFRVGVNVTVGGAPCATLTRVSAVSLTCVTAAHAAGSVSVIVSNPDSQSATTSFLYAGPPTVTSVSPNVGGTGGNSAVSITGTGFLSGATVMFGTATPAACTSPTVVSSTQIDCMIPASGTSGAVSITVTNADSQSGSLAAAFTYQEPPTLTTVSPSGGSTAGGTPLTLTGTFFRAGVTVRIGSAICPVTAQTATSITCTIPAQTAGARNVTVTNTDNQSASITNGYTYLSPPTVTGVSPDSGALAGGTVVTITGTNFFSGATVDFGGSSCGSVFVTSATSITCTTTARVAGTVNVTVTNVDTQTATIAGAFTYRAAPTITSVTPSAGALAGGTSVTISGTGFVSGVTASFGGSNCAVTSSNATTINCTTTSHGAGAVSVVVSNPDAQSATSAGAYTYQPAPTLTSASPAGVNVSGGDPVTLTGTGFVAGATVLLGGVACPVSALTATSITCTSGVRAAGVVSAVVTNADSQTVTLSSALIYLNPPTVSSVSPSAGALAGGTTLTITGTEFFTGATVSIGGSNCPVVSLSATQISCTLPAQAAGTVAVSVTNVDTQTGSLAGAYTYQPAPTVTSVAFNAGPLAGGTSVTVNGTNFLSGATVRFDTSSCVVTATTATTITCLTPAHAAGSVAVTVTNPDSQAGSLGSAFTYQNAPTISSVSPAIGSSAGGTTISITGTGFLTGSSVSVGSVNCAVTAENSTSITCTTSARAAGTVDVIVTNTDSQSATRTNSFTYLDAPTIATVSPNAGALAGGSTLTISGTNFFAGAAVSLGGSACTVLTLTGTSITCRTTARSAGLVAATVTNIDSQTGNLAGAFEYRPAPTVTSVSPSFGAIGGGTAITVTGTGFVTGASVNVGSAPCTITAPAMTATTINCTTTLSMVSGSVAVTVINPVDLQQGTRATSFIYLMPPTISAVSPSAGPLAGGSTITITGTSFFPGATVTVDGSACTGVSVLSDTSITCVTPAHAAGSVPVVVTNSDSQFATRASGFTYQVPPNLVSVSPASGRLAGGTSITLTGTDFVAGATVRVGGSNCTSVVVVSSTSITCNTPPGLAGTATVEVRNADGQVDSLAGIYTYQSAPTISAVSPSGGPLAGNTTITITGTNFLTGATVSIGGSACGTVVIGSSTSLTCVTPARAAGSYTVSVTNVDNQLGSRVNGFTYQGAPTVTNISPAVGASAGNTLVTISGTNFLSGATVSVGGVSCTSVTVTSATSLTCRTGAHAAGAGVVAITNPDTQSGSGSSYLYQDAPAITSVTPATSPVAGNQAITITGTGFLSGATVRIGGSSCTSVVVVSLTSITCITPARTAGVYDLTVTNSDTQVGTLTAGFTYQGVPVVSGVSPALGAVGGGQIVTITGSGFIAGATVLIGSTSCAVSAVSSSSITCTSGASLAGLYSVTVTNPDTQTGSRASSFRYIDAPTVSAISPTSGTIAGGTSVTITGTNFFTGSTVSIGGSGCTSVTIISPTSITCVTPAQAAGTVSVDVVNAFGATGTLAGAYTYAAAPASLGFVVGTSSPTPPNPDNYGTTTTNITHTFTVRNNGASASSNLTMSLGGANPVAWAIGTDTCSGAPLAAGASCTIQVTFLGAFLSSGAYTATVVGTAATGGTVTNTIQGTRP